MLIRRSWAEAFVNSVEKEGGEIEEGLDTLMTLASCVAACAAPLQGVFSGRVAAEKLEPLLRKGITISGKAEETALRFFLLMVRGKKVRYINSVIEEVKNILNKKRGIVRVFAEYAFPPDRELESLISEAVKKRTGAAKVELKGLVNQALIGGYRLRIGDEIIDASVRCQLRKMEACLAGYGGN